MKKVLVTLMLVAFAATTAVAADAPASVTVKAKNGDVTFNHKVHSAGDCKTCHKAGTPGKLALGGKDAAHGLCINCHKEKAAGPTKCNECHKK